MISLPMHCAAPPPPKKKPCPLVWQTPITGPHICWVGGTHKSGSSHFLLGRDCVPVTLSEYLFQPRQLSSNTTGWPGTPREETPLGPRKNNLSGVRKSAPGMNRPVGPCGRPSWGWGPG